jgi:hypothetical protein
VDEKLNPEQIKNWRNALLPRFGPITLILPDEAIQKFRDAVQAGLDREMMRRTLLAKMVAANIVANLQRISKGVGVKDNAPKQKAPEGYNYFQGLKDN